jgi:hypothetical protein
MTPKNNDTKGLCFTIVCIVDAVLTYFGYAALLDFPDNSMIERIIALPLLDTMYVLMPHKEPGSVTVGVFGSLVLYFAIGTAILIVMERVIKKRREKKQKNNRI